MEFLNSIFDEGDKVCSADNPYATDLRGLSEVRSNHCYVTLNALVDGTTRADKNVSTFRNFLVEFDDLPKDKQLEYVNDSGLPYTTCVFSGNKSFHFVISLDKPLESREEYSRLVNWIYAAVPEADKSCKNPSRFTRLGGGTHKNGTHQAFTGCFGRVSKADLMAWLRSRCEEPVDVTRGVKQLADDEFMKIQESGYRAKMHKATLEFCKTGGRKGHRHKNSFIAACNLRDCYYTLEEAKFLILRKLEEIYTKQGRLEELELKERAIEDAFLLPPRTQVRS